MSNPAYIGVDADSPLGILYSEFNTLLGRFEYHLSDPIAHPELNLGTAISLLQSQVLSLQNSVGSLTSNFNSHLSNVDPHPQYYNITRGAVTFAPINHVHPNYVLQSALNAHVAAGGNPHPQYITQSELNEYFYSSGFKSMAYQPSNAVHITGGTIEGVAFSLAPRVSTIVSATAISINWEITDEVQITLAHNPVFTFTVAPPTGRMCTLTLKQGAGGNNTITFPANVKVSSDMAAFALAATPGKTTRVIMVYNASTSTYEIILVRAGY